MIALQFEMLMTFVVVNNRHLPQKMKSLDLKMESFQPDQIRLDLTRLLSAQRTLFQVLPSLLRCSFQDRDLHGFL